MLSSLEIMTTTIGKDQDVENKTKPFDIPKSLVLEAYHRVKQNQGGAGVDQQSLDEFDKDWENHLYKIWNRMSSGSYFPPPVKVVEIPKDNGKTRTLGIPTVSDRIAQMVVKMCLEVVLEPIFHPDSYGYRPGKSALDAVKQARDRCWEYNWVLDLDIQGFFDHIDHDLLMKAVRHHTKTKWIVMYIERWLKAPAQLSDGTIVNRTQGTPQGGVISPLLANLFLHYALDMWLEKNHPNIVFERYADDSVIHCRTKEEAERMKDLVAKRLSDCKLELNTDKTQIAYCKDEHRKGDYPQVSFDFLGYTFRPRSARNKQGRRFVRFLPGVSRKAANKIRQRIREWKIHRRTDLSLEDIARLINPIVNGWINYYGKFYKSLLYPILNTINRSLNKWSGRKYKRFRSSRRKTRSWLSHIFDRTPTLFSLWTFGIKP